VPLDQISSPPAIAMIPTFGARSKVRSKWISIGGADQNPSGQPGLVRFLFGGIETALGANEGKIKTVGSAVEDRSPLININNLGTSPIASVIDNGFTLQIRGGGINAIRGGSTSGVPNDIYLRTPTLFQDCAIRMRVVSSPTNFED